MLMILEFPEDHDEDYIFGRALGTMPHHQSNVSIKYTVDTPRCTAPEIVYSNSRTMGKDPNVNLQYNLTWIFLVDAGFFYLVRLHFCETQIEVTLTNQRVFSIFIYNQTTEDQEDVIEWSGGNGIPVHIDYVVLVPKKTQARTASLMIYKLVSKTTVCRCYLELHGDIQVEPIGR